MSEIFARLTCSGFGEEWQPADYFGDRPVRVSWRYSAPGGRAPAFGLHFHCARSPRTASSVHTHLWACPTAWGAGRAAEGGAPNSRSPPQAGSAAARAAPARLRAAGLPRGAHGPRAARWGSGRASPTATPASLHAGPARAPRLPRPAWRSGERGPAGAWRHSRASGHRQACAVTSAGWPDGRSFSSNVKQEGSRSLWPVREFFSKGVPIIKIRSSCNRKTNKQTNKKHREKLIEPKILICGVSFLKLKGHQAAKSENVH